MYPRTGGPTSHRSVRENSSLQSVPLFDTTAVLLYQRVVVTRSVGHRTNHNCPDYKYLHHFGLRFVLEILGRGRKYESTAVHVGGHMSPAPLVVQYMLLRRRGEGANKAED